VELQLGYAVFSGFRQINGQSGILFGVQSPSVAPSGLMEHIVTFLNPLPERLSGMGEEAFILQRQALSDQFALDSLPVERVTELLWQGKLAGRSSDYLGQLPQAILAITPDALQAAAHRLIDAEGGWRCLASDSGPKASWQVAK
jgi:secreted Zn-dependent insulinase-like peptidase